MKESIEQKFVDHPAPSAGLMSLFIATICVLVAGIPCVLAIPTKDMSPAGIIVLQSVLAFSIGSLCFYIWPLYTTYYIVDKAGITVKYGPWTHVWRWDDFKTVYWQQGMFVSKIGWPSVTPCVRLSNGLIFAKKHKFWGLYITPNDPKAFIEKVELFAPELTKEMIK